MSSSDPTDRLAQIEARLLARIDERWANAINSIQAMLGNGVMEELTGVLNALENVTERLSHLEARAQPPLCEHCPFRPSVSK